MATVNKSEHGPVITFYPANRLFFIHLGKLRLFEKTARRAGNRARGGALGLGRGAGMFSDEIRALSTLAISGPRRQALAKLSAAFRGGDHILITGKQPVLKAGGADFKTPPWAIFRAPPKPAPLGTGLGGFFPAGQSSPFGPGCFIIRLSASAVSESTGTGKLGERANLCPYVE